jgi:hypothetical protein
LALQLLARTPRGSESWDLKASSAARSALLLSLELAVAEEEETPCTRAEADNEMASNKTELQATAIGVSCLLF